MKDLYQKLRSFSGKKYGLYKSLAQRSWNFGDFTLNFLHVQGDPYAPASRISLTVPLRILNYSGNLVANPVQGLAFADYLLRRLVKEIENREDASMFSVARPGQEMLLRNTVSIGNFSAEKETEVQILMGVKLPGDHRLIDSPAVIDSLTRILPDILLSALYGSSAEELEAARKHIETLELRNALQEAALAAGFVAFISNGAVLPRASGLSDLPRAAAFPFKAPENLTVTLEALGKKISGMGISKGITVIAGGAYHGKSTLLSALESAVYPHIPGDGRELVVVDPTAFRVRSEEGRSVRETRIAPLVRRLPGDISTEKFSTTAASGSTSEAANLFEALECGVKTVLIDEDVSAVNFLIRDTRMRNLLGSGGEPLIPLIERVREMADRGIHFIFVIGACGDFLAEADQVIVMNNYRAEDKTQEAKKIVLENPYARSPENYPPFSAFESRPFLEWMKPLAPGIRPASAQERLVKVRLQNEERLQVGYLQADLRYISGLRENAERYAAGLIALNAIQSAEDKTLMEALEKICGQIQKSGFGKLPQGLSRDTALPRPLEIAAVLFRLTLTK